MTPNATRTKARLAAATPTDLTSAVDGLRRWCLEPGDYGGGTATRKRLPCSVAAWVEAEESGGRVTVTLIEKRRCQHVMDDGSEWVGSGVWAARRR